MRQTLRERRAVRRPARLARRTVWSLAEAREVLERLIGQSSDWARLDEFLISFVVEPSLAPTVFASSFASTLEMVREGVMEVHQQTAFVRAQHLQVKVFFVQPRTRPDREDDGLPSRQHLWPAMAHLSFAAIECRDWRRCPARGGDLPQQPTPVGPGPSPGRRGI